MMDRDKVIKALECCTKKVCCYNDTEKECPYWELCGEYEGAFEDCTTALAKDALALLKAQEPIEARLNLCESCTKEYAECEADNADLVYGSGVGNDNIIGCPWYVNRWKAQEPGKVNITNSDSDGWKEGNCPFCGMKLDSFYNWSFCGTCGRAVKWNG